MKRHHGFLQPAFGLPTFAFWKRAVFQFTCLFTLGLVAILWDAATPWKSGGYLMFPPFEDQPHFVTLDTPPALEPSAEEPELPEFCLVNMEPPVCHRNPHPARSDTTLAVFHRNP